MPWSYLYNKRLLYLIERNQCIWEFLPVEFTVQFNILITGRFWLVSSVVKNQPYYKDWKKAWSKMLLLLNIYVWVAAKIFYRKTLYFVYFIWYEKDFFCYDLFTKNAFCHSYLLQLYYLDECALVDSNTIAYFHILPDSKLKARIWKTNERLVVAARNGDWKG